MTRAVPDSCHAPAWMPDVDGRFPPLLQPRLRVLFNRCGNRPARAGQVSQDAAEALVGAVRRAIPLILICAITAAVAVNLQRQLNGPVYSATASVYVSARDLASILTNTQAPYVDPQRESQNAVALAAVDGAPEHRFAPQPEPWHSRRDPLSRVGLQQPGQRRDQFHRQDERRIPRSLHRERLRQSLRRFPLYGVGDFDRAGNHEAT